MIIINKSKIWDDRNVIKTIFKNIPTLDPLSVLFNSDLYSISENNRKVSFATLKKMGSAYELGTVFTDRDFRGKGYASLLVQDIIKQNPKIFVLCEPSLKSFYKRQGFNECIKCHSIVDVRRRLFNFFLTPFVGYKISSLKI